MAITLTKRATTAGDHASILAGITAHLEQPKNGIIALKVTEDGRYSGDALNIRAKDVAVFIAILSLQLKSILRDQLNGPSFFDWATHCNSIFEVATEMAHLLDAAAPDTQH